MENNNSTSTLIAKGIYKSSNKMNKTVPKKETNGWSSNKFKDRKQFITKRFIVNFGLPISLWEKLTSLRLEIKRKKIKEDKIVEIIDLCLGEIGYLLDDREFTN